MTRIVLFGVAAALLAALGAPATAQEAATYTLAQAVAAAVERNPQVRAAEQSVRAAEARAQALRAALLPSVSLSATGGVSGGTGVVNTSGQVGAGVSYLVYDGGLREAQIRQAEAQAQAARENLAAVRSDVALAAVQAFIGVVAAERFITVREQAVAQARGQVDAAQAGFRAGTLPQSDVLRALSQLASAEVELIEARALADTRRVALRAVLALGAAAPIAVVPPEPPPALEVSQQEALQRAGGRPEVRRSEADVRAAEASLAAAMIAGGITVTLDGRYVLVATGGSSGTWSVGAAISLPVYDGGRKQAQVEEARAALEAARARLEQIRLQVQQEAVQAHLALLSAVAREQASQRALAAAREAHRVAEGRYRAGVGTILEVATARTELTAAEVSALQAAADRWTVLAALRRAMAMPVLP
ncbi:MAG: TolC family protein [Armatimonadota bacterium]|nr:TolC family protein [Armatimonadota bacterium]MDR5696801.1 TolC family protein [Armatimonadota bacterium]